MLQNEVTMPLSFTAIKAFEQCPQRFYQERVLKKFPYEQSEEAKRGDMIHKAFENFIKDGTPLPDYAEPFRDWVEVFAEQDGDKHAEFKMAMDWQAKKVGYFRGKNIWIRGQFDLLVDQGDHAVMIDYKTGKSKFADTGQLELMSILTFIHFPKINTITGALVFIDEKKVIRDSYSRDKMPEYIERWTSRSIPIVRALTSRKFPMKQSGLCGWCPVIDCPYHPGG